MGRATTRLFYDAVTERPAQCRRASGLFEPDLAQDLRLMLAEPGRAALEREQAFAHQDRRAEAGRALRLDPHPPRLELRIGEEVGHGVDRPGRNHRLLQRREKLVALP